MKRTKLGEMLEVDIGRVRGPTWTMWSITKDRFNFLRG